MNYLRFREHIFIHYCEKIITFIMSELASKVQVVTEGTCNIYTCKARNSFLLLEEKP